MGIMHQHQRGNAVTYVYFKCKNLDDYDIVKNALEAA